MTEQLCLFTSAQAKRQIAPRVNSIRERVYTLLGSLGPYGATDEEILDALGGNPNTLRPRRIELAKTGRIVPAGTRRTRSGALAVVWRAV
jgi:hypothetical protein